MSPRAIGLSILLFSATILTLAIAATSRVPATSVDSSFSRLVEAERVNRVACWENGYAYCRLSEVVARADADGVPAPASTRALVIRNPPKECR